MSGMQLVAASAPSVTAQRKALNKGLADTYISTHAADTLIILDRVVATQQVKQLTERSQ